MVVRRLLRIQKKFVCKGYFCDYTIKDKVENTFGVKDEVLKDLIEAEKGSVKLLALKKNKYMVTISLLEKVKENLPIIDQILNLFNIVNPDNDELVDRDFINDGDKQQILDSIQFLK